MSSAATPIFPSRTHSMLPTRVVTGIVLALIGVAMSAWAYQFNSRGPLLTWGIFPGAPFVLLAGMSLVKRVPLRVTIGAFIAGVLAIALPYGAIWSVSLNYNGGGANIGLGILALAAIVLVPIPMLIGGFIGWLMVPPQRTTFVNEALDSNNQSRFQNRDSLAKPSSGVLRIERRKESLDARSIPR